MVLAVRTGKHAAISCFFYHDIVKAVKAVKAHIIPRRHD
jgi:hypothetical protein